MGFVMVGLAGAAILLRFSLPPRSSVSVATEMLPVP